MIKFMHVRFTDMKRAGKYAFWFRNRDAVVNQLLHRDRHALERGCLFLEQIKREKGVWWMPWQ